MELKWQASHRPALSTPEMQERPCVQALAAVYVSKIEAKAIVWENGEEAGKSRLREVVSHLQNSQEKREED
ncbi:MAG: hypothetical protein VX560_08830 [SAR324 cluster bacterium]|nr:hypothetical protein [SAR324 cluster bacterium]